MEIGRGCVKNSEPRILKGGTVKTVFYQIFCAKLNCGGQKLKVVTPLTKWLTEWGSDYVNEWLSVWLSEKRLSTYRSFAILQTGMAESVQSVILVIMKKNVYCMIRKLPGE